MRSLLVAFTLVASCHLVSGLDSFKSRDDAGAGGMAQGGGLPEGGGGAGGTLPSLVDEGLVARYFLDESAGDDVVVDAAPVPVNLSVMRNASGDPSFVGRPGRRGAHWAEAGQPGQIFANSGGTKLEGALQNSTTATIETVLSVTDVDLGNTRLVHFGSGVESGRFSLRADAVDEPVFYLDGSRKAQWNVSLVGPRVVLHVVFDSNVSQDQRARLYVGGEVVTPFNTSVIEPGAVIDITGSEVQLHIGNRPDVVEGDGRSAAGVIHYVALYDIALSPLQIAQNADRLTISDDP